MEHQLNRLIAIGDGFFIAENESILAIFHQRSAKTATNSEPIVPAFVQASFLLFVTSWLAFGFFCSQPQELISIALGLSQKKIAKSFTKLSTAIRARIQSN